MKEKGWYLASADGFWQSVSSDKERQLVSPVAVKIRCDRGEKICREIDAIVDLGLVLKPDLIEYEISSWTESGITADAKGESDECGIEHRLSLDFKSNSVTVTDYPTKATSTEKCRALQGANSYALHGGQLMLYPAAQWDPRAKQTPDK
jgi:hypothetical protein